MGALTELKMECGSCGSEIVQIISIMTKSRFLLEWPFSRSETAKVKVATNAVEALREIGFFLLVIVP